MVHASKLLGDAGNAKSVREIPRAGKYFLPKGTVILKLGDIVCQIMRRGHHWEASSNPHSRDSPCKRHNAKNLSSSFLQKTRQLLSSPHQSVLYIYERPTTGFEEVFL